MLEKYLSCMSQPPVPGIPTSLTLGSNTTMDILATIKEFKAGNPWFYEKHPEENQFNLINIDSTLPQFKVTETSGTIFCKDDYDTSFAKVFLNKRDPAIWWKGQYGSLTQKLCDVLRFSTDEYDPIFLYPVFPHLIGC